MGSWPTGSALEPGGGDCFLCCLRLVRPTTERKILMDDAKTPNGKRDDAARSKEKQAVLDKLCNREFVPVMFDPVPPPPWETPEDFITAVHSVCYALDKREHRLAGFKSAAWVANGLWKDCLSPNRSDRARIRWKVSSPPPECPDAAIISQYEDPDMVRIPEDGVTRVQGVLATVLRWADAEKKAQAEGGQPEAGGLAEHNKDVAHSVDFRSLRWFGERYSFTPSQAPVVRVLYEHWKNGTLDVGGEALLMAVDPEAPPARLSALFLEHPAWNSLIVPGGSKGTYRFAEPEE